MLDYARQRAKEILKSPQAAVLVTSGPAGVQVGEYPCEVLDLDLYLLLPQTSDHLFNLEHDSSVSLQTSRWDLKGEAQVILANPPDLELDLLRGSDASWCVLVLVHPLQVQVHREGGWGNLETIDLNSC